MTTTQENDTNQNDTNRENEQKALELIKQVYQHSLQLLKLVFAEEEVDGQVANHEVYGPLFTFRVKDKEGNGYACGFFMRELLQGFQQNKNPALWLSSFFVDLMKTPGGVLLPPPPKSEDDAKALMDKNIIPRCIAAVKEEFAPEEVYAGLDLHKEHGPVLEAGFPKYKDGNNVCAMPLHLLLAHYLLNREPADLLIQGLYRILDEQNEQDGAQPEA